MAVGVWVLVVLAALAVVAAGGNDCIFELGDWAFAECERMVSEARAKRPDLERGVCEVVQDQIETFMQWRAGQLAEELGVAVAGDMCARFKTAPYEWQAHEGVRTVVQTAIERNTRDRTVLGIALEQWADGWLRRVAKDADNSAFEFVPHTEITKRVEEFQRLKNEHVDKEL